MKRLMIAIPPMSWTLLKTYPLAIVIQKVKWKKMVLKRRFRAPIIFRIPVQLMRMD